MLQDLVPSNSTPWSREYIQIFVHNSDIFKVPKIRKIGKLKPQATRSSRCHDFREALLTQILQVLTSECVRSSLGVIEGDIRFGVLRVFKTHRRSVWEQVALASRIRAVVFSTPSVMVTYMQQDACFGSAGMISPYSQGPWQLNAIRVQYTIYRLDDFDFFC